MQHHPSASLFPMLDDKSLQDLAEDIHKNGLLEPIVIHEGMILDGRNRFVACELAGVQPAFTEWNNGVSPTVYVLSKNLHRRHLTTSQRAAVAAECLTLLHEEAQQRIRAGTKVDPMTISSQGGRAIDVAAKELHVGSTTVWEAEQIKKESPEEFERVKRGEVGVHKAFKNLPARQSRIPVVRQKPLEKLPARERAEQIAALAGGGHRAEQIAQKVGLHVNYVREFAAKHDIALPDAMIGKTRKIDVNRIVEETVIAAQGLAAGLDLVEDRLQGIDVSRIPEWTGSLSVSVSAVNRLIRQLRGRLRNE